MEPRAIRCSVVVNRPAAEIFGYLTDATKLERWFASQAQSDARKGGAYHFTFKKKDGAVDHVRSGTFTRVDAGRGLAMDWDFGQGKTAVEIALTAEGGATRLELSHSGFRDGWEEAYSMHEKGWNMFLQNLKSVVEEGRDERARLFG